MAFPGGGVDAIATIVYVVDIDGFAVAGGGVAVGVVVVLIQLQPFHHRIVRAPDTRWRPRPAIIIIIIIIIIITSHL